MECTDDEREYEIYFWKASFLALQDSQIFLQPWQMSF